MNALPGQEAKSCFVVRKDSRTLGAGDGRRDDGGYLSGADGGLHLRGRWKFGVLHDGARESKLSQMVREEARSGWQRRANLRNLVRKNRMTVFGVRPMLERLSHRLIGYRVKAAREAAGWNQDRLAELLGLNDRQSVSDLENGKRRLLPDELVVLSDALDRDVEFFLDPFVVAGEAQFSWRAEPQLQQEQLDEFELRAGQWIGLLRWLREQEQGRTSPLKHSLRLTMQSSFEEAISRAEDLVEALKLGKVPAERLIDSVEKELDIPVLFVDTLSNDDLEAISGATCHLQDLGVILINRHEPEARRFYDLAHELFHALTWDAMKPEHRESNSFEERGRTRRIEQLANNFAAALLMPTASLEQLIDQRHIGDVDHLADVAAELRVAPTALAWRLFNMRWIDQAACEALRRERQRTSVAGTPKRFSPAFVGMLHRAIDHGRLSARKAAKAVGMSLPQLGDLFAEHSMTAPYEL